MAALITASYAYLIALQVVSASCVTIFGILTYWMLVFERNSEWLRTYQDSLWLIVITAFTVGYGDIFPRTFPGRAISVTAGILGVIFAALGTAALSNKLAWTTAEFNVSKLLMKNVIEKKLAQQAVIYLQRTFRRITNRERNHFCMSQEAAQRRDLREWKEMKQKFSAFKQNQDNMELLLKGILDDSGKIGKVTEFLKSHDATKEWISTVAKSGNHQLQLVNSVNVLEEQLKNLESVSTASLEKQLSSSTGMHGAPAVVAREQRDQKEEIVDPNDGIVNSLIQELSNLCDVLDENNKDLEWFAKEIDTRVRGKRRDEGPLSWQSANSAVPPVLEPHFDREDFPTSRVQQQAFSNGNFDSQFQTINTSGQAQHQNVPEMMNAMQQQAALQMQMQTTLMTKLFQALESPKRSRSRSRGRDRSLSRNRREGHGRSRSAHSHRSRSEATDQMYSSDEENYDNLDRAAFSSNDRKSSNRVSEEGNFPKDGEVWIDDEDQDSLHSRPVSAASRADVHPNDQTTPRLPYQSNRVPRMQRR